MPTATRVNYIHVVEWATEKSIHVVDCRDRDVDKVDNGMNINLDHDKYYTKLTDCPHEAIEAANCVQCAAGVK